MNIALLPGQRCYFWRDSRSPDLVKIRWKGPATVLIREDNENGRPHIYWIGYKSQLLRAAPHHVRPEIGKSTNSLTDSLQDVKDVIKSLKSRGVTRFIDLSIQNKHNIDDIGTDEEIMDNNNDDDDDLRPPATRRRLLDPKYVLPPQPPSPPYSPSLAPDPPPADVKILDFDSQPGQSLGLSTGPSLILLDLRTSLNLDLLSQLDPMDFMDLLNFYMIQRWMCRPALGSRHTNPVQNLNFKHLNFLNHLNTQLHFHLQFNTLNHLNSQLLKLHNLIHTLPRCINLRQTKTFELTGVASNFKKPCRLAHTDVHHLHAQCHIILHNMTKKMLILDFQRLTLRISKLRHCQEVGSLKTATSPWKTTPKIFGSSKQDV